MNVIITGPKGAGKSTHLLKLAELLKKNRKTVSGVISRGFWNDKEREGYEIVNPADGTSCVLATKTKPLTADAVMQFCSYYFRCSAFTEGNRWINGGLDADVLFIDEVGNLEIAGGGWDIKNAVTRKLPVILGVREDTVYKLESSWGIKWPVISIKPGADMMMDIVNMIQG